MNSELSELKVVSDYVLMDSELTSTDRLILLIVANKLYISFGQIKNKKLTFKRKDFAAIKGGQTVSRSINKLAKMGIFTYDALRFGTNLGIDIDKIPLAVEKAKAPRKTTSQLPKKPKRVGSRASGTNPRALGVNPRAIISGDKEEE